MSLMGEMSEAGERLLETAIELFYAEGIGAVGVDTLVERAGVSKPTLYAQFGSKAGLVAAVLDRRRKRRQWAITAFLEESEADPKEKLLSVFEWMARDQSLVGSRGCPFVNAAVELPDPAHPARVVIAEHKDWLRSTLTALSAQAGLADPEELGNALLLLIDGAHARVLVMGDHGEMSRTRATADRLINPSGYLASDST